MKKLFFITFVLLILLVPKTSHALINCAPFDVPNRIDIAYYVVNCSETTILQFFGYVKDPATKLISPIAGNTVVTNIINNLRQAVSLVMVIGVVVFGYKVMMGGIRDFREEGIKLLLMMVFILWFLQYGIIFFMPLLTGLSTFLVDTFSQFVSTGTCNQPDVWERVDCIIGSLLGMTTGTYFIIFAVLGALIFSSVGIFIIVLILTLLFMLVGCFATAIFTYIMCYIAIVFLFAISPAIMPLMLFKFTKNIVKSWVDYLVSYAVQPCIVIGYVTLMLAVLNTIAFGSGVPTIPPEMGWGISDELNALPNMIEYKNLVVLDLSIIKVPYISTTWFINSGYRFFAKLIAAVLTTYLLYMFMINVAQFANQMTGLKAGSVNMGTKFNAMNMAMTIGKGMAGPLGKMTGMMRQATKMDKAGGAVVGAVTGAFGKRDSKKRDT